MKEEKKVREPNLPYISCQVERKRGSRKNNNYCNVTKCTSMAGDVILPFVVTTEVLIAGAVSYEYVLSSLGIIISQPAHYTFLDEMRSKRYM